MPATTEERMLLHLMRYQRYRDEKVAPYAIIQQGIAEALDIRRDYVAVVFQRIRKKDPEMIEEKIMHVIGLSRKRKVYFLTAYGYQKAKELRERIEKERIKVRLGEEELEIRLQDIGKYIDHGDPLLSALNMLDEDGIIDLSTAHEERKEDVFAGRENEMERLREMLETAEKEGCRTLFISGEAGIGKTRLVMEFKKYAVKEGFEFLVGNSYYDTSEPYLPFREAFGKYLERKDEERRGSVSMGLLGITAISPKKIEDKRMFDAERHAMWYDTTERVKETAGLHPLVIFLDDLQWADQASLQLLHYMAAQLGDAPVLFIGAYRPEEVDEENPMWECRARMFREHLFNEVSLGPLTWKDTRDIIRGIAGRSEIPSEFVRVVHETTNGNPLFIKECIKQMLEDGIIDLKKGRYPETKKEIRIPKLAESVIKRRLKRLEKGTQKVLQKASVIGERVPFDILQAFTGMDEIELLEHLDILLGTGLLEEDPKEEIFSFSHSLIHLAVYRSIGNILRQRYHKEVAEKIGEIRKEDAEDYYSDIAYHYEMGKDCGKAVEYYYKAGRKAEGVYAHEDAIRMFEKALELRDKARETEISKTEILEKLGGAHEIIGEYDKAKNCYQDAVELARTAGDFTKLVELDVKIGDLYEKTGKYDEAIKYYEKGMDILSAENEESRPYGNIYNKIGWVHLRKGEFDIAIEYSQKALEIAEKCGDKKQMAQAYHLIGTNYWSKGKYNSALEFLNKAVKIREKIEDLRGLSTSYNSIGIVYWNKGDLDLALEFYKKALEIKEKIGDRYGTAASYNNIGIVYYNKGELDLALEFYKKALEIKEKIGDRYGTAASYNNIGNVYKDKGKLDLALEFYKKALEIKEKIGDRYGTAASYNNIGIVYKERGGTDNLAEAAKWLEKSVEIKEKIGDKLGLCESYSLLSECWTLQGDYDKALEYGEKALSLAKEIGARADEALSYHALGIAYRKKRDWGEAEKCFEESLRIFKEVGKEIGLGKTYREYGLMWRKKGDRDRAEKYLKLALEIFEKKKLDYEVEKTGKVLQSQV